MAAQKTRRPNLQASPFCYLLRNTSISEEDSEMETELPYPVCLFRLWICTICEDPQLSSSNHNKVAQDAGTFFHYEG